MAIFCIPPAINRKLKAAIDSGKLEVKKLLELDAEARASYLESTVGKSYSNEISKRFGSKFNVDLSSEAVDDIINSMAKISEARSKSPLLTTEQWKNLEFPPEWAREYVALQNRMANVVNPRNTQGLLDTIKSSSKEALQKITDQPTLQDKAIQTVKTAASALVSPVYKSLKASMDLSYALRQGFKVFTKSPEQWGKGMVEAFQFIKNIGNKDAMDALMAEFKATYYAHPNYDKLIGDGKLAFGIVEDWFPTTVAEKIPALGNIFKSSNDAFTVFSQSARFGIANDLLEKQTVLLGRELTKDELKSIGYIANSITGRGSLGRLESVSGHLNKLLFSARYISSQVDTFTMPFKQSLTPFARKEALKHSIATISTIGALLTTASFFTKVETDPRSSRFGKMKVGENWIDLTAGLGSYIVLASKQASGKSKSSTTGKINKLNSDKFGAQTRADVLQQWFEGKLAPGPSVIDQAFLKGELYGGEEVTPANVIKQLTVPISFDNTFLSDGYLTQDDKITALIAAMADVSGLGVTKPFKK